MLRSEINLALWTRNSRNVVQWARLKPLVCGRLACRKAAARTLACVEPACSVAQSCPTLCDPLDHSPPGFSFRGILQTRNMEWVAIPVSRGSSPPGNRTQISCISGSFFTVWAAREARVRLKGEAGHGAGSSHLGKCDNTAKCCPRPQWRASKHEDIEHPSRQDLSRTAPQHKGWSCCGLHIFPRLRLWTTSERFSS